MKKGFTIVEVSILFVIFLIVAFLVAPLSLNDSTQAKNISRWRSVQQDFANIFTSIKSQMNDNSKSFKDLIESTLSNELRGSMPAYKITAMNGTNLPDIYKFEKFNNTYSDAVLFVKIFENPKDELLGVILYDVNGKKNPNIWGKDVFGMNIYKDRFEPFGKNEPINIQKKDCSRTGTGLYCSNYYLIGGNFD